MQIKGLQLGVNHLTKNRERIRIFRRSRAGAEPHPLLFERIRVAKLFCLSPPSRSAMSMPSAERQPLLPGSSDSKKCPLGPRDISFSNRVGILSGVWLASFLSVSRHISSSFTTGLYFAI